MPIDGLRVAELVMMPAIAIIVYVSVRPFVTPTPPALVGPVQDRWKWLL